MKVGAKVSVKEFGFTNKAGGTGLSNWEHNEKFEGVPEFEIIKSWYDDEVGHRFLGVPSGDELIQYLDRNAKKGIPRGGLDDMYETDIYICFFSEYSITKIEYNDN